MKRFLVFAGSNYYPSGGWQDFAASFDTAAEAHAYAKGRLEESLTWAHVVDAQTGQIVEAS